MRLRTFTAPDMPTAMKMVRDELGDGAIILTSDQTAKSVVVTAAVDDSEIIMPEPQEPRKKRPLADSQADDLRFEIQNILRFHNVPELFVAKMMQNISDADLHAVLALHRVSGHHGPRNLFRLAMEKLAGDFFAFAPLELESKDRRIMLVGPPGIGKTLTIAKMSARLAMDKLPPVVITTDNKRAGGIEQLQAFTNILKLELKVATSRDELAKALKSVPMQARVLVDTAGCNPYDHSELHELKTYATIEGIEPVLVLPAGGDSLETIDTVEALSVLPVKRLMITRADTARRFGGILAAAAVHRLAFCNVSSSSSIADTLQPLDSALLAQLLLRYQLQTS